MISIDWATKVISVPRTYGTLVQTIPSEIRSIDLNLFRLDLKDLEDDVEGMTFLDTHSHNAEVLLGGIVYARVLEIINGYTITFEDGQYAVNLLGANSNVGDNVNVNQVSVRSANSAGLISNQAIEFSSFNNGVTIDVNNNTGFASVGSAFPIGTRQKPSNNLTDTSLILGFRGLTTVYVLGNIDLDIVADFEGYEFWGESALKTVINVTPDANVLNCEFYDCTVTGTLDGNSHIEKAVISNLNFVDGFIFRCAVGPGAITLGNTTIANIFSCYSSIAGSNTPTIDLNETGILALRDYNGGVLLVNYTGNGSHSIDLSAGQIKLDPNTITSGTFIVRGVGKLIDIFGNNIPTGTWNGGVTIINELLTAGLVGGGTAIIDYQQVADAVWDEPLTGATHNVPTSAGRRLRQVASAIIIDGTAVSSTINTITFNGDASAVDGAYDPALIAIIVGTGAGQSRMILEYKGSTKTAVVDRNWKVQPDDTSEYVIFANPGREHINEGLAQGATSTTITLNANASAFDNVYSDQTIFLRSGEAEDQTGVIISYNGTTKVATLENPWAVIPDNTTAYVVLPAHVHPKDELKEWDTVEKEEVIAWARKASDNAEQANLKL